MLDKTNKSIAGKIINTWDTMTEDMNRIYDYLIDGKSELATITLRERIEWYNGQGRDFITDILKSLKE